MPVNKATIDLITEFEGFIDHWYPDPAHGWKVPTAMYGHTNATGNQPQYTSTADRKLKFTKAQAIATLKLDLLQYEKAVLSRVTVPLNDNQFGALVSFTFNLGAGNLGKSTLLKKVNAKDWSGVAAEFAKWNKAGGKVLAGLTKRRKAEAALFLKPTAGAVVEASIELPKGPIDFPPTQPKEAVMASSSKTPTIKDVQLFLNRTENARLVIDGNRGPATAAAVVAWQTKHDIVPATGILDPKTLGKMFPVMDNATTKPLTIQATVQDWVLNFVESRINQVAVAAAAVAIGWITTKFGINVSPELQQWVTSGLIALGGGVIVFLRGMGKDTPRVASRAPAVIQKPDMWVGQKD